MFQSCVPGLETLGMPSSGRCKLMIRSTTIKLLTLLTMGGIASCNRLDHTAQLEPSRLSEVERNGIAFREKMLTEWKAHPSQFFLEMDGLCREGFTGRSLQDANAMMRAAGQAFDLTKTSQPAVLTPPGTTPYAGGLSLHSSMISSASFNVMFYAIKTSSPGSLIVKDVSCGVREVSL